MITITKGAPINDVIAFNGKWMESHKNWTSQSDNNKKKTPNNPLPKSRILWFWVLKIILTRLGTANPTKAIGPQ